MNQLKYLVGLYTKQIEPIITKHVIILTRGVTLCSLHVVYCNDLVANRSCVHRFK